MVAASAAGRPGGRRPAGGRGLRLVARRQQAADLHQHPAGLAAQHPRRLLGARPRAAASCGKLGGANAKPSTLMFAKFSPDGGRVAYVRENNLYVEDLASGAITALTTDGSRTLINGTFDWVYEEELMNYYADGWRWSPDGQQHRLLAAQRRLGEELRPDQQHRLALLQGHPDPVPQGGRDQLRRARRHRERRRRARPAGSRSRAIPANHYIAADGVGGQLERGDPPAPEPAAEHATRSCWATRGPGQVRTVLTEQDSTWVDVVDDVVWLDRAARASPGSASATAGSTSTSSPATARRCGW